MTLTDTDREAMRRAIEISRAESPARAKQIDSMLTSQPWESVGRFAAGCAQSRALRVLPWETLPMWVGDIDAALNAPDDARRTREAAELLQRLLRADLSRFEPSPLAALAEAEQRQAAK
jgi:hypothetical protein